MEGRAKARVVRAVVKMRIERRVTGGTLWRERSLDERFVVD